jgi:hypothetical protein
MTDFVSLPPDGIGKKIRHHTATDLTVTQLIAPKLGDTIVGSTSGASGTLSGYDASGLIQYFMRDVTGDFTQGENVRNPSNTITYGSIDSVTNDLYTPMIHLVDKDNHANSQRIDSRGAAYTTFPEGTPQFDSYGRMQVSQMQIVGEYYFVSEDQPGKYWQRKTGVSGTDTYIPQSSTVRLQLGTTSGDRISRTTNQYHPYKPATSQLVYISMYVGDNGKPNVQRQWGYFDDFNGVGFRLSGTDLQVFLRSDTSGSTVEQIVSQSDWNVAKLNDLTSSEFILNVSKPNTYWIDVSYARIRLGVLTPDGRRITVHDFSMANNNLNVLPRSFNLPIRWSMANLATSASTSEMYLIFATVFTEIADIKYSGVLLHTSPPDPVIIPNNERYNPFLSFRAKLTINGLPNRIIGIHEDFDWCGIGGSPLHIGIFVFPDESYLTGVRWSSNIVPSTMLEVDRNTTSVPQYQSWITSASFTGSISGTTLTVTALGSGMLEDDQYIVAPGIAADTKIIGYLTGSGGTGTYILNKTQTLASTTFTGHYGIKPIESFIASGNDSDRIHLGDRMEKSFGLAADGVSRGCFVFAAKAIDTSITDPIRLFYTKYWKEIR